MPPLPPFLLVDDSHDDLFILKRLLSRAGVKNPFVTFDQPQELQRFLQAAMQVPAANLIPGAILSDKAMPGMDGFELLQWVREYPSLRDVPFVMLSSSQVGEDEGRARALGGTAFFEKFPSQHVFADIFGVPPP